MYAPELFEITASLERLRAKLNSSQLPAKHLRDIRARADGLSDECNFHIGWLCARPNEKRAAAVGKEKLAEIDALMEELARSKSKVGRRPRVEVPLNDRTVAVMYLRQPPPGKSVEQLIDEAIKHRGFDGRNTATSVHARRIRRLIKRMRDEG